MAIRRDKSSTTSLKRRHQQLRRKTRRGLRIEQLEERRVFASPQLVSINPNAGDIFVLSGNGNVRDVAPRELTFRFDEGQLIDPASVNNTNIKITRSGLDNIFGQTNDVVITPGYIGIGESPNEIVVRFAENLPDDMYRIDLVGAGTTPLRNQAGEAFNNGQNRQVPFELNLGPQVIAVVPQPVRTGGQRQIDVYFSNDDFAKATAENLNFYKLIFTRDTVSNLDDVSFSPVSANYDATKDMVTLTFENDLNLLTNGGPGTYRLRIGTNETLPSAPQQIVPGEPGATFNNAHVLANPLDFAGVIITASITPSNIGQSYNLVYPGNSSEPGHRDQPIAQNHVSDTAADTQVGVTRYAYNFQKDFGGGVFNQITPAQEQRAREIFEFYSFYLGIDFYETASQGITVATGDLAILNGDSGPGGVAGLGGGGPAGGMALMDVADTWDDSYGGSWFSVAMHEIGHVLGLGHTYDLPPGVVMGSDGALGLGQGAEPVFPSPQDIVHGQYLYRPDSIDIDMYRFEVTSTGTFTAESFAERLTDSSALNSVIRLYKEVNGVRTLIAQNDDYYSEDSFLKLKLDAGTYYIGVSSTGNDEYDPGQNNTGIGGTSQGQYQLRLNFRADVTNTLADATGVALDGDLDGIAGGVYDYWFKVGTNTIYVNKAGSAAGDGSLGNPFNNIPAALAAATSGSVVRILGNGGTDGNILTTNDTLPYLIGTDPNGNMLADGRNLEVPKGVTVMIDAGAVFKSRRGTISVGSNSSSIDRSGGGLQVLGTPVQSVIFTSYDDDSFSGDTNANGTSTAPAPGNWGGLVFQADIDKANQRFDYEAQGIFINYVNHADIRYGGGSVVINSVEKRIAPIYMEESRPTITFNTITLSADAAMSADPNSFEETNFHAPIFQRTGAFTYDYDRVGPDIYGNVLARTVLVNDVPTVQANSQNGLFIRIDTISGGSPEKLTKQARFDDLDIVHLISENLVIAGTPGGGLQDAVLPSVALVTLTSAGAGTLPASTYTYRVTFVDANGNESPPSLVTNALTVGANSSIRLNNLPLVTAGYVSRRIYRSVPGNPGEYVLAAQIVGTVPSFVDNGTTAGGAIPINGTGINARTDARLAIDPGVILKLTGARIEAEMGTQFIAEGTAQLPIIFTSINDDRYGAGGTFDQTGSNSPNANNLARGNWGGIFLGPLSSGSIDHAVLAYGGGSTRVAGSQGSYNVLEVHQARARVTHSIFEQNAAGVGGTRFTGSRNESATIFVRGAQPIIVDNIIRNNAGAAININVNSLDHSLVVDYGRSTGGIDKINDYRDNQGALVRLNRLLNNGVNGMVVRGETLLTESVWDDTDITHVLFNSVNIVNFHTFGGLRLESSQTESLVVKLLGQNAGFTASGKPLDIDDRIGGILTILGQAGRPVILTSLRDDSVGAGKRPDGRPQTDTNNDGNASAPAAGDWRSVLIDQYANDRNVDVVVESEPITSVSPGNNSTPSQAQALGQLAKSETHTDENLRLGYVVHGFLNANNDVDVYSFDALPGTEVWLDIDRTTSTLDTILELVDADGVPLARSNNSFAEAGATVDAQGFIEPGNSGNIGRTMQKVRNINGVDYWSQNLADAGMRVILPGSASGNTLQTYFVRVRSNGPQMAANLTSGQSSGVYQLQVRIRETDELPGSTVRFTNIGYSTNGIEVYGQPTHSQLVGEGSETGAPNDTLGNATNLGNILNTDRMAMSIAGSLGKQGLSTDLQLADVDFYRFDVRYDALQQIAGVTASSIFSTVFDLDYGDRVVFGDMSLWLFDSTGNLVVTNRNSGINDDRPRAGQGDDSTDLSRGSSSTFDPFIGAQILPEGTYYIAVTSQGAVPAALSQSLARMEPVNSVIRIVEDHIGSNGGSTAAPPVVQNLVDASSAIPFFLGDVTMYLSQEVNTTNSPLASRILTVDPFTGRVETVVNNNIGDSRSSFNYDVGDLAFRADGTLVSFTIGNDDTNVGPTDANSGQFLTINTGTGVAQIIGDDGIVTYEAEVGTGNIVVSHIIGGGARVGYGIQFNATTFFIDGNGVEHLYAVGNRGDSTAEGGGNNSLGIATRNNLLYEFNTQTGAVLFDSNTPNLGNGNNPPGSNPVGQGTDAVAFNEILTAPRITAPDATFLNAANVPVYNLLDRNLLTVTDGSISTVFEFDAGYDIQQTTNLATGNTVRDGNFFLLDGVPYQINTGSVIEFGVSGAQLPDGVVISVNSGTGTASFEFDNSPPPVPPATAVPPRDPQATQIPFGNGTTSLQLAGALAAAINGAGLVNGAGQPVTAQAVGNRVTLINELTAAVDPPPLGFTPNMVRIAGDAGAAPIVHAIGPATAAMDGQTFSIQVQFLAGGPLQTVTFEFDNNGASSANNTTRFAVPFTVGMTGAQLATAIQQAALTAANNNWPITTQLGGEYVVFNGRAAQFGTSSTANLVNVPIPANNLINVEESFTAAQIGAAVKATVGAANVGAELTRINFINVNQGEFYVNSWTVDPNSTPGVAPGNVPITFLADGTQAQLATRIASAINGAIPTINAQAAQQFVRLARGSTTASAPVVTAGQGPGGVITGMTQLGGRGGTMYAVSSNGGLYSISLGAPGGIPFANTTYIGTSRDDLEGINFSSLTDGPSNVEGGRYANMLFATDVNGRIYAFNTAGVLQPIFVNGATSVDTGLTNVNGLGFANLDENLFTQTTNRGADVGHGINPAFDGSRGSGRVEGGNSVYFGNTANGAFNYNYIGGAHGSLVTNEFSLKGYAVTDLPTLYFNYFVAGDGTNDVMRAFIGGADGEWRLVSSITTSNGGWRQARVSIPAALVGQDQLRLRFDFSTSGDMNVGDAFTTGDELRAIAAEFLNDEDTFSIDSDGNLLTLNDDITFEFDLGPIIVADSGAAMRDQDRFTLTTTAANGTTSTRTFEINKIGNVTAGNVPIAINDLMTPSQVATAIRNAIQGSGLVGVQLHLLDNRLNIKGLTSFAELPATGFLTSKVRFVGQVGVSDPDNVPVDINLSMNRTQVASAIDAVLERVLADQRLLLSNGTAYQDGQTFTLDNTPNVLGDEITFEFETGYILQIPALGTNPGGIADGNVFKIITGTGITATTHVFEFNTTGTSTYTPLAGETLHVINLQENLPQQAVARAVETAIDAATLGFNIDAKYLDLGRVQLHGNVLLPVSTEVAIDLAGTPTLTSTGTPGVALGNVPVVISNTTSFTAGDVARAVERAFDSAANPLSADYSARVDAHDQRRVAIVKNNPTLPDLVLNAQTSVISLELPVANDISKQYKDLLRIIGHKVTDAGPLGLEAATPDPEGFYANRGVNTALAGDSNSFPFYDPIQYAGLPNRRVGFNSPLRLQNNNFEGFYLDDIIIGFAERGEMVTGTTPDSTFTLPGLTPAQIAVVQATNDAVSFPYQLEIRGGQDYGEGEAAPGSTLPDTELTDSFDTNTRLAEGYQLQVPKGSELVDGRSFIISDGINLVRFEFEDINANNGVTPGSTAVPFSSTDTDAVVAQTLRNLINSSVVQSQLPNVTAASSDGTTVGTASTDGRLNITGKVWVQLSALASNPFGAPPVGIPGSLPGVLTTSPATMPDHVDVINNIPEPLKGDSNRFRDQGQILLSSNVISNALQFGMVIDAGQRTRNDLAPNAGNLPHPGVVRNIRTVNTERLVPGVVAMNNIIAQSGQGGIRVSGDPNTGAPTQLAPVPFARIVNNTIYGSTVNPVGVGIQVDQNASPTLMNNIVSNLATGVSVDASSASTVLTGMLYKGNTTNTQGTGTGFNAIALGATDPLFVNAAAGNFYLAAGSQAIDSSVDNLADRNNYVNYKTPAGIGASPIISPSRDVTGQLRQDDPAVEPPSGVGSNVFKDRGAVDRVDFAGPTAVLTTPRDNDANGLDQNPGLGDVNVSGVSYNQFTIQLLDGLDPFEAQNGTGIDDTTVNASKVTVLRGVTGSLTTTLLVLGVDYTFSYDAVNDTITLTPLTGVWATNFNYVITLDNTTATGIKDLAGNSLKSNRANGTTVFNINLGTDTTPPAPNGIDYGDAPDPTYPSLASSNGPRHIIQPGFHLGAGVTADTNARPNNTDTDDGVSISSQLVAGRTNIPLTVTASATGVLDAWIDFNGDGTFSPNEKIFDGLTLTAGANVLNIAQIPQLATGVSQISTFARFRFSTAGSALPTGLALNGEVEDYALQITKNPYTNPGSNPFDVNADGKISPIDALLIVNFLNFNGPVDNAVVPRPGGPAVPYLDVNNDGNINSTDVAEMIAYLNSNGAGDAEPPEELMEASTFAATAETPSSSATIEQSTAKSDSIAATTPAFLVNLGAGPTTKVSSTNDSSGSFTISTFTAPSFTPATPADIWANYLLSTGSSSDDELEDLFDELADGIAGQPADEYFSSLGA